MRRLLSLVSLLPLLPVLGGGCSLFNSNEISITYDVMPPQEFAQDFGAASGNVPTIPCSGNAGVCGAVTPSPGTTVICDATTHDCAITADLTPYQTVNLSQQSSFPSQVANSSVIRPLS